MALHTLDSEKLGPIQIRKEQNLTRKSSKFNRRALLTTMLAGGLAAPSIVSTQETATDQKSNDPCLHRNPLLWAVAWSNTAAEFGALCHQAFNLAKLRVKQAKLRNAGSPRPLAVITDIDNTIFHAGSYWSHLIDRGIDFFDDEIWDRWIPTNLISLVPGALEFLTYCKEQEVEVFYVTNRDQGTETYNYALRQLQYLELPYADSEHLTVFRDSSDKTPAREGVKQSHELVLLLGDNLNDFKRDYYVANIEQRFELMERDRQEFGDRFIVLPNPTDGHWVRAIFGESEPAPTRENRSILLEAVKKGAWGGE